MQYLISEEGEFMRRQIILALTADNRLHTEEVQRLWALVKDDMKPEKLAGAAWNALIQVSTTRAAGFIPAAIATLTGQQLGG
jgi:hypothetical protein